MSDFEDILPLALGIIVAIILFFGLITVIKKTIQIPVKKSTIDRDMSLKEQQWRMDDVRRRQKQLLRDQKQKMRDMQRR